jgi:hypothetical protein
MTPQGNPPAFAPGTSNYPNKAQILSKAEELLKSNGNVPDGVISTPDEIVTAANLFAFANSDGNGELTTEEVTRANSLGTGVSGPYTKENLAAAIAYLCASYALPAECNCPKASLEIAGRTLTNGARVVSANFSAGRVALTLDTSTASLAGASQVKMSIRVGYSDSGLQLPAVQIDRSGNTTIVWEGINAANAYSCLTEKSGKIVLYFTDGAGQTVQMVEVGSLPQ